LKVTLYLRNKISGGRRKLQSKGLHNPVPVSDFDRAIELIMMKGNSAAHMRVVRNAYESIIVKPFERPSCRGEGNII
jgi:hypothetical protein